VICLIFNIQTNNTDASLDNIYIKWPDFPSGLTVLSRISPLFWVLKNLPSSTTMSFSESEFDSMHERLWCAYLSKNFKVYIFHMQINNTDASFDYPVLSVYGVG
jgi:hypothetical protein